MRKMTFLMNGLTLQAATEIICFRINPHLKLFIIENLL